MEAKRTLVGGSSNNNDDNNDDDDSSSNNNDDNKTASEQGMKRSCERNYHRRNSRSGRNSLCRRITEQNEERDYIE